MSKKRYYVQYWRNFDNTYNLYWADDEHPEPEDMDEWDYPAERITRKDAEHLARRERWAKVHDSACSGFADDRIFPIDYDKESAEYGWQNDSRIYTDDVFVLYA